MWSEYFRSIRERERERDHTWWPHANRLKIISKPLKCLWKAHLGGRGRIESLRDRVRSCLQKFFSNIVTSAHQRSLLANLLLTN
jgi:hypothetical protein